MTRPVRRPFQSTLKKPVSFHGIGLHSGKEATMTIRPASAGSGIRFLRTDISDSVPIPAYMNRVVDTRLATTIAEDSVAIATTEHLLAAFSGLGVDNAIVELNTAEVPIMDGSSAPFVALLQETGLRIQKNHRRFVKITRPVSFHDGERHIRIDPYNGFKLTAEIDFSHPLINRQSYSFDLESGHFTNEIAAARTFGFVEDVERLRQHGLALGGSLDNAVVIGKDGILNQDGLRFTDEFVRHKILDLIGDLSLLGCPLIGQVTAYKSGHSQHLGLMQEIAAAPDSWEFVELRENGQFSILDKVVYTTKTARKKLLPFLIPCTAKTQAA